MVRVTRLLLDVWPESINVKTNKESDCEACVDMAGKHHPTKHIIIALLREARSKVELESLNCNDAAEEQETVSSDDEGGDEGDNLPLSDDDEFASSKQGQQSEEEEESVENSTSDEPLISMTPCLLTEALQ